MTQLKKACESLELHMPFDERTLKKQYHKMALRYHPDKNSDSNAEERFKDIGSSYTFLSKHLDSNFVEVEDNTEYNDVLGSFVKFFCNCKNSDIDYTSIFMTILSKVHIIGNEEVLYEMCKGVDVTILVELYEFLMKYEMILGINKQFTVNLKKWIDERSTDDVYIVNPSLLDLFDNNIYKLERGEKTIYIPMWHSELVYECNNSDLVVKCIPELPDHVNIDEMNNLHVYLKIGFAGILSISDISFSLGGRNFNIPVNELLVKDNQLYYLKNCGISRINEDSVYDDSRRSHIIVHIDFI